MKGTVLNLQSKNENLIQYVSCLENELESNVNSKKNMLEEVCKKMESIQKLEDFLSQSIQNQKTVSDKMQGLARENMDLRIELRQMQNLKHENRDLEMRLIETMNKLSESNNSKYMLFETNMKSFYDKSLHYQQEQREKNTIKVLEEKLEVVEKERNMMEIVKMEAERRSRSSQIELSILRMELEKLASEKNKLEKRVGFNTTDLVQKLKISIIDDYQYLREQIISQSNLLSQRQALSPQRTSRINLNMAAEGILDSSFHNVNENVARNIRNRIVPESAQIKQKRVSAKKKKKKPKVKRQRKRKTVKRQSSPIKSDDSDNFYGNVKYGLKKQIFDTMK